METFVGRYISASHCQYVGYVRSRRDIVFRCVEKVSFRAVAGIGVFVFE